MFARFNLVAGAYTNEIWVNPRSVRMVLEETKEGTRITGVGVNGFVIVKGDVQTTLSTLQNAVVAP
tara:strand:+ start:420 stop:617 length:198 start_codon:yes stop_codon:yes gene_type:complete